MIDKPCAFDAIVSAAKQIQGRAQAMGVIGGIRDGDLIRDVQERLNAMGSETERARHLAQALWRLANACEAAGNTLWRAANAEPDYDRRGTVDCHECENGWKKCTCIGTDDGDCMCDASLPVSGC